MGLETEKQTMALASLKLRSALEITEKVPAYSLWDWSSLP